MEPWFEFEQGKIPILIFDTTWALVIIILSYVMQNPKIGVILKIMISPNYLDFIMQDDNHAIESAYYDIIIYAILFPNWIAWLEG